MTETLRAPRVGIRLVDSPDDGGHYFEKWDTETGAEWVSVTYPSESAAMDACRRNAIEWE